MKNSVITYAFKKSIPVLLGYIFLGIAFGITAQSAGFRIPWIILTSVIIYAGSMQFALVPLMVSSASLPIVALTTLMVNSRHLFYGISFIDDFAQMGKCRPYMIFSLTDETFATLTSCKNEPIAHENNKRAYFLISLFHQCYWITGTIIGAIAGQLITADTTGIDFSMTALFVVILVDQIRSGGKSARTAAIIGLIIAVIMLLILGADNFLLPTLICTVIILYIIAKTAKEENA